MKRTASIVVLLFFAGSARAELGPVTPVSAPSIVNRTAAGASSLPAFSGDGQYVVFVSEAPNLVTNDNSSRALDVFRRQIASSNTVLVSVNLSGVGGGDRHSLLPSVSSNGQFVAFESTSANLIAEDTNAASDIFVRDLDAGLTVLVSANRSGGVANGPSRAPLISGDGRWIAFESAASDLVPDDLDAASDVFLRDLLSGTTTLVSRGLDQSSELLRMTSDGRFVVFTSITTGRPEVFVSDSQAGVIHWVTRSIQTAAGDPRRFEIDLTDDGRYVALHHVAPWIPVPPGSAPGSIYRHDLLSGSTTNIPKPFPRGPSASSGYHGSGPQISADGQLVAFSFGDGIAVYDFASTSNRLAVTNFYDSADMMQIKSFRMSPDFSRIFFTSYSTNYAASAANRLMHLFVKDLALQETRVLDTTINGVAARGSASELFAISQDGLWAAFESTADDLVAQDGNRDSDVFIRHATSGPVRLVSERVVSRPASTGAAVTTMHPGSFSANGSRLIFASYDNTLTPNDTNRWQDLFFRYSKFVYLGFGIYTNVLVTAAVNGPGSSSNSTLPRVTADARYVFYERHPNAGSTNIYRADLLDPASFVHEPVALYKDRRVALHSSAVSVSQDGRFAVFQTTDSAGMFPYDWNYTDTNNGLDIILRDYGGHTNWYGPRQPISYAVSLNHSRSATGDRPSWGPTLSLDGQWVVYHSRALNLVTNNYASQVTQLFAWDVERHRARLVSVPHVGGTNPVFSADSGYVAFRGAANSNIYVYNFVSELLSELCTNCANPALSADGTYITYESQGQIFLYDAELGAARPIGSGSKASISYDGRYVLFESKADNLAANDRNGVSDIFLYDNWKQRIMLVSATAAGSSGNGPSTQPVLSPDGRTISFQSFASDLVAGDYNIYRDVFMARVQPVDIDRDGMDDDWELLHFGDLAQQPFVDFDLDRVSNIFEFWSGTDPTVDFSYFRTTRLSTVHRYVDGPFAQETTVWWSAVPGRTYRLFFKTNLTDSTWHIVPGDVTAGGTSASKLHSALETYTVPFVPPTRHRFYRVWMLP